MVRKHNEPTSDVIEGEIVGEISETKAVAVSKTTALVAGDGRKFVIGKQVTRPVLTQVDGVTLFVSIDGPIHLASERPRNPDGTDKEIAENKKPPHIVHVTNLETGELQTLIANAVLKTGLEENYPNETYIGRAFAITSQTISVKGGQGKRMRIYDIKELQEQE